jgi:hypothetical protein
MFEICTATDMTPVDNVMFSSFMLGVALGAVVRKPGM